MKIPVIMEEMETKSTTMLVVMASNRPKWVIDDQIEAIKWACHRDTHIVVVSDNRESLPSPGHGGISVIQSMIEYPDHHLIGFKVNQGFKYALDAGIDFKLAWVLDDDTLPIGQGIDTWALNYFKDSQPGLLGVQDRVDYEDWYAHYKPLFVDTWEIKEAEEWYPNSATIYYACHFMSPELAKTLYERNLLIPPEYQKFDQWPDPMISWLAQMLGFYMATWGSMDKPKAPLYANHTNHMRFAPEPRILRSDFLVYHALKSINGYTEKEIREHYQKVRQARSG